MAPRPQGFDISCIDEGGVEVVAVAGELDVAGAPALAAELSRAGAGPLLLDMCGTTFVDSSGLRALIEGREHAVAHGRRFALACSPDGALARLLSLSGTDTTFELFDDRASALAALRS